MAIQWTDKDPETGGRRYLNADMFAQKWTFRYKLSRRGDAFQKLEPTLAMWVFLLERLKARYRRREGVSDVDVARVEKIIREWREPPTLAD